MELKTKGQAVGLREPLVAKVTRQVQNVAADTALIVEEALPGSLAGFQAVFTTGDLKARNPKLPYVHHVKFLHHLQEGDIVVAHSDGVINTLYRASSVHNFLLATERCNSNCLMCSQPPRDRNDVPYLHSLHKQLIPLIPKSCGHLGITGGEPTLLGSLFFDLLGLIKEELPNTAVHCLTNGRSFAWRSMTARLAEVGCEHLTLGIPLYADYCHLHDYIVQAKGAYNQTMQGLYHLAEHGQQIELRVVLHKQTIPRLVKLAHFIYKNLPFVAHVAFMGLEYQGYTPFNIDKLWIDPVYYMAELGEAVEFLAQMQVPVSIYNTPLCLLPEHLWPYSRKSISDWKNVYLNECKSCSMLEQCGGLFASGLKKHSDFIKSI